VAALIWLESGGNASAYSHSGAVGLMQVMPRDGLAADFVCSGKPCFAERPSIRELRNPEYNIQYGTQMLQSLVAKHSGNYREALREYGPIDVGYSYADDVLALYRRYGE
jgi:soluble lytic murein transglycosylase-like protein